MTILSIPVTKAKAAIDIDTDQVHETMYAAALKEGLKTLVNGGMSKVTKETYPNAEELKAKAWEIAQARALQLIDGSLKLGRSIATKGPSGAVMTEARRLARDLVKAALKAQGLKVSHYESSEITRAANAMIEQDSGLITMAEANIAARGKVSAPFDPATMIHPSQKLVEAAEEAKAKKAANKVPLSAKQAGKVAPRASHAVH